jgi:hypothetical protein
MATPYPFPDGLDRKPRPAERLRRTVFNIVAFGAIAGVPVATVSLWLLLTDPLLAGEVAESGSAFPVARALFFSLGRAIAAVLAYL